MRQSGKAAKPSGKAAKRPSGKGRATIVPLLFAVLPFCRSAVAQAQTPPQMSVSANPVRQAPVVFLWTATSGSAAAPVFSVTGTRVATASLGADPGRWSWDLTNESSQPVVNGAYFVVVTRGDGVRMRRRVLVAR